MKLPPGILPAAVLIFLFGGVGQNTGLALVSMMTLVAGSALLWRPGETPILLFIFGYQWAEASIATFHANWLNLDVVAYAGNGGDTGLAIALTLTGLLFLAVGMRLGAGAQSAAHSAAARSAASAGSVKQWFWLYLYGAGVAFVALAFAYVVPGLSQPLIALADIKWAFFYILAYASFVRGLGGGPYFIGAFALELAQGIGGYFSDFKSAFLFTLFAAVASGVRMSVSRLFGVAALSALLATFGIAWTAVKSEYRGYVSGGQAAQIVTVDYVTRAGKLYDLVRKLDLDAFNSGADQLLRRLSYVELFGAVINIVPQYVPYAGGAIWWDAVSRPFMPRLLFADKAIIDDSLRTNLYTGGMAGTSAGTSISLGYPAESYIDFGTFGMMVPIFLVGFFYGQIYRRLLDWPASRGLLGMAMSSAVLYGASDLGSSITKTFGGVVVSLLVAWLFVFSAAPRWFPWLRARSH
jgi:hypothetical protein